MRTITSDRLLLRPWRDDDAGFLWDLESRWDVVSFLGARPGEFADERPVDRRADSR